MCVVSFEPLLVFGTRASLTKMVIEIGTMLINNCKNLYEILYLNVYEKNVGATMFYKAMGFKKIKVQKRLLTSLQ